MRLPIVRYDSAVLRRKGTPVTRFDAELATLARDMIETMHEAEGIGLAAQQIGRALQLCVVDLREVDVEFTWELDGAHPPLGLIMPMALANPQITFLPSDETDYEEGCLSFPGLRGTVHRPDRISVAFQDLEGRSHTLVCTGLLSRCVQHEVDHLNGVLFIDRMEKASVKKLEAALKDMKRQTSRETLSES